METSALFNKYIDTIEKLLDFVDYKDDRNKMKADLLNASYLNFVSIASENPKIKPLLLVSNAEDVSLEEFEKKVEEVKVILEKQDFDFVANFNKAMKQTLSDLVFEFEPKLPPGKVTELDKLISESF